MHEQKKNEELLRLFKLQHFFNSKLATRTYVHKIKCLTIGIVTHCDVNGVVCDTARYNRLVVGRPYRDVVMPVTSQGDQL